ncbi:MAG TPA: hypothetical protein VFD58_09865 [Blastocatellia bacterium]|nr:hypothetical protein [Blastocatellia bacterium]
MSVTREEKVEQLDRVLQGRTLHGSENLRAFLRFVALRAIDNDESQLKEYVIATEVFGRGNDFDPKIDSVVRVQAGRLRVKLQEYYATEGKADRILIDLPKGQYTPVFSYTQITAALKTNGVTHAVAELTTNASAAHEDSDAEIVTPASEPKLPSLRRLKLAVASLSVLSLVLAVLVFSYRRESLRAEGTSGSGLTEPAAREEIAPLWGELLRSPEPVLVVFSNTLFQGTAEEGMKLYKSLDSPGGSSGSPALNQSMEAGEKSREPLLDHYTGIGEVMGMYFLGDLFARAQHPYRVKRSLLLNWDDTKSENIVVLGSPAENFFLRDLPQKQDFLFRPLKDEQQKNTFGIVNTRPQAGEQQTYLAKQDGPSRSQIAEDYAVISLLQGLSGKNRLLILAGITTYGTQAAAEYVSRPEYIRELIAHLNTAPPGQPPKLPDDYQILIRVKVNGGVPIQVSYVSHHVLSQ